MKSLVGVAITAAITCGAQALPGLEPAVISGGAAYPVLGAAIGQPSILNLVGGYHFTHAAIHLSGMYWGADLYGAKGNLWYTLFENRHARTLPGSMHAVGAKRLLMLAGFAGGITHIDMPEKWEQMDTRFFGPAFSFQVNGVFIELAYISAFKPSLGPIQLGYLHFLR